MKVSSYVLFDGACEEAFNFYAKCFGAKITMMMTFGELPMADHVSADWRGKMVHAQLDIGGTVLMGSDAPPGRYERPQGCSVSLTVDDPDDAERIFAELLAGGETRMPLQHTFFARRFGMLVDRFAIPWMVSCE